MCRYTSHVDKFQGLLKMNLRKPLLILFISVSVCLLAGCKLVSPTENIPSYIHIDKINLNTTTGQGSNSNKITDAWVYVDDQLVGAFELPATFPVLSSGTHNVTIKAGIKVNGIAATRAIYPFYSTYSAKLKLVPDSIITIHPTITYNSYTVFSWMEDFEGGGISLEKTIYSDTSIDKTSDPTKVFEGTYSGIVHLDAAHDFFQCETIDAFTLPTGDSPVFLEMNYKTTEVVKVGLVANTLAGVQKMDVLFLNKTDTWNKIYINLNTAVNTTPYVTNFQVFLDVQKSTDATSAELLFDDFKLVHN